MSARGARHTAPNAAARASDAADAPHPRLSKLMSMRGLCSRREADRFIQQGLVRVDGEIVAELGARVDPRGAITLAAPARAQQRALATVLLNKPSGYVSGTPQKGYRAAATLVTDGNRQHAAERAPSRRGLAPAGRLDLDSMGLLVLTQDGRIAKRLVGADSRIEKEYEVRVEGAVDDAKIALLRHGLHLDGRRLRAARVERIAAHPAAAQSKATRLRFILTEGRKRQIRRMCEQLELRVSRLVRVRIGAITLDGIERGRWRLLRADEDF